MASAQRAFATGDMRAAASLFDRAIALMPDDDDRLLTALLDMAAALMRVGEFDRSRSVLVQTEEMARSVEDTRVVVLAQLAGDYVAMLDDVTVSAEELRSRAMEAVEVFHPLGDELGLAKAFHMVGQAFWLEARFADAEEAFVQAVSHAERAGDEREVRENLVWMALATLHGPVVVDAALQRCDEIFDRAKGNRQIQAFAKASEGGLLAMRGDFERARASIREGQGVLGEFGWVAEDAGITQVAALVEILAGDLEAAASELRRGCDLLEQMGEFGYLSTSAGTLAAVLARQGHLDEADRYITTSLETGSPDDIQSQVDWRIARAEVLARRGDVAQAVRVATEAVDIANRTDAPNSRGNARVVLASVLREAGRLPEAAENARLALAEFERKGNLVSAGRVREILGELS